LSSIFFYYILPQDYPIYNLSWAALKKN